MAKSSIRSSASSLDSSSATHPQFTPTFTRWPTPLARKSPSKIYFRAHPKQIPRIPARAYNVPAALETVMRKSPRNPFVAILHVAILLAAAPLSVLSQTNPQSDQPAAYKSDAGNFSANFPGEPKDTDSTEPNGPRTHTIQSISGSNSFMVVYVVTDSAQTVNEANFTLYRDAFFKSLGQCEIANESAASPDINNFVGRSYHLNCTFGGIKLTLAGNLYYGKHFSYAVLTVFEPVSKDPPEATTFLHSFSVTDTTK
jgi:hypothetical protein